MATTPYPFVAAAVLTASQLNSTHNIPVATKTDTYVLVAADAGKRIVMNKGTASTITVNTSLFSAGDTLELSNIGAGVCTLTSGTCTVTSTGSLALAQWASGTLYFTSTSAAIYIAGGVTATSKIAQVLSTTLPTTFTSTSASWATITGLSQAITPTLNTSTILVMAQVVATQEVGVNQAALRLVRDAVAIDVGTAAGSRTLASQQIRGYTADYPSIHTFVYLDSPATTSATTYAVQGIALSAGTWYINRSTTDTDSASWTRTASTITVMEILA